jgi:protein SCO1/2
VTAEVLGVLRADPPQREVGSRGPSAFEPEQRATESERRSPAEEYFTTWSTADGAGTKIRRDITLVDQNGKSLQFYTDLLKDHNVVIHTFFSTCKGACPRMFGTMSKLQHRLGDRVGKDVLLISITVDPTTDTPEKLRTYAAQLRARAGWSLLTGRPEDVLDVVRKLHPQFVAKDTHSTRFFVGNLRTNIWAKPDVAASGDDQIIEAAERIWDENP